MARVNKTRYAVLGCLSIRPMSAYEIIQFISRSISHFWSEGEGQIYPALKKLYQEDLVSFEEQQAKKIGTKKIYSITNHGKEELKNWLAKKAGRPVYRNELLLKLFFGSMQTTENNFKLLQTAKDELQAELDILLMIKDTLTQRKTPKNRLPYINMCLDYGIEIIRAELKWNSRYLKTLAN